MPKNKNNSAADTDISNQLGKTVENNIHTANSHQISTSALTDPSDLIEVVDDDDALDEDQIDTTTDLPAELTANSDIDHGFMVDTEDFRNLDLRRQSLIRPEMARAQGRMIDRNHAKENHIHIQALILFLTNLLQILVSVRERQPAIYGDRLRQIEGVIGDFIGNTYQRQWQAYSLRDKHLSIRDLFDACRHCFGRFGGAGVPEVIAQLRLFFTALKGHHLASAAPSVVQQYLHAVFALNERYTPSLNQGLPDASQSKTQSVSVKGGAGVDVPLLAKATIEGGMSLTQSKERSVAFDSIYAFSKTIEIAASFEVTGKLGVSVAGFKINGKIKFGLTFRNYQENSQLAGLFLLNFTDKHPSLGRYLSGETGRKVSEVSRKFTNIFRGLRGIPKVVPDAPYYLTQKKVSLGSGNQMVLQHVAARLDVLLGLRQQAPATIPSCLLSLVQQAYGMPENDPNQIADVSKSYGDLASTTFTPHDIRVHQEGYGSKIVTAEMSAQISFGIGVGAGGGQLIDVPVYGENEDAAKEPNAKTPLVKNLLPSLVNVKAQTSISAMYHRTAIAARGSVCEALDLENKTLGGSRRVLTKLFELLIEKQCVDAKTYLLRNFYQVWINQLVQAVVADKQDDRLPPLNTVDDLSEQRDIKQLGHQTTQVKRVLQQLKENALNGLEPALIHLEEQLDLFFQDHLLIKKNHYLQKKNTWKPQKNQIETQSTEQMNRVIFNYWGAREGQPIYRSLKDDFDSDHQLLIGKTLDNFDLCTALLGVRLTAARQRVAETRASADVLQGFAVRYQRLRQKIVGWQWHVSRRDLNDCSSIIRVFQVRDIRVIMNMNFLLTGPQLGITKTLFLKAFDEPSKGAIQPHDNYINQGVTGMGLSKAREAANSTSLKLDVTVEYFRRYRYSNKARLGHFIKLSLGIEAGGFLLPIIWGVRKALSHFFKQKNIQQQLATGQESIWDTQQVSDDLAKILHGVAASVGIFEPARGKTVEFFFRISTQGSELLFTKHLQKHISEIKFSTPNLLAAVPFATLSLSLSDLRKNQHVSLYALENGFMSHFATWRRWINTRDGLNQKEARFLLTCGQDAAYTSLYTQEEFHNARRIGGLRENDPIVIARKNSLKAFALDTELFYGEGVAWMVQRYLNTYRHVEGEVRVLHSSFGDDADPGQLAEFMGSQPSRLAFAKAATEQFFRDARFAATPPDNIGVDLEPNRDDRVDMRRYLFAYRDARLITPEQRMNFFLTTREGRLLFHFYSRFMISASNRITLVAREGSCPYLPSLDGIPGEPRGLKKRIADYLKQCTTQFQRGDGLPPEQEGGQYNPTFEAEDHDEEPDVITTRL
jgi:hypothetical protein